MLCLLPFVIFYTTFVVEARNYHLEDYDNVLRNGRETVRIDLYYECLCPYSRDFYVQQMVPVVEKLGPHLDVHTYPYGNAQTTKVNGKYVIKCQHGPKECYGNELHACAIDNLKNVTEYVTFVGCMMEGYSDDTSLKKCGGSLEIDTKRILSCAKSDKGFQLLKYYGDLSNKISYPGVPYCLVNGKEVGDSLKADVCAAFKNPPKECTE